MVHIGQFNTLSIKRINDGGIFLDGGESGEIPFKPQDASVTYQLGDQLSVFVYTDGRGNLLATLKTPLAQVDEVAWLKVVSLSRAGAFLDWGLPKDLLVPYNEQKGKMVEGRHYLVKLFLDEDNRIAATMRLDDFIQDEAIYLKAGQAVDLIIAGETALGIKAVVNHAFWGVLYKNEVFQPLSKGQKIGGFINKIRADKKIDLILAQANNSKKAESLTDTILAYLNRRGGSMALTDKSPPELIYQTFGVSKKVFKQALGRLYKQRLISIDDNAVRLTGKS